MISSSSVWRVDLRLKPSRTLLLLTALLHAAALLAVYTSGLDVTFGLPLAGLVLLSLGLSWRQEATRGDVIVREQESGYWLEVGARQGRAELQRSLVWRYLVVMDFHCRDEAGAWRQRVVVLPDALNPDAFRRLRVRLRHGRRGVSAHRFLQ